VSAETLNEGRDVYLQYCAMCHGARGEGRGPAARHMEPPPRAFTTGIFSVAQAGALPTDDALLDVLRRGVRGTAMTPLLIGEAKGRAVIQYLKTLSPRWRSTAQPAQTATRNEQ
jgi:mono/diheme cytochrome c family protein